MRTATKLKWTHEKHGEPTMRAWAPHTHPEDGFPPIYVVVKPDARTAARYVCLLRGRPGHREVHVEIGPADNLTQAKAMAQTHYEQDCCSAVGNV
jgi:hypothetical protein